MEGSAGVGGDDLALVEAAASRLEIGEFELFRMAWSAWFEEEPGVDVLERQFAPYMWSGIAPPWVRHYARAVMARADASRSAASFPGPGSASGGPGAPLAAGVERRDRAPGGAGLHPPAPPSRSRPPVRGWSALLARIFSRPGTCPGGEDESMLAA